MALQSSGAISISQIRTELGSSSYSLRTLSAAAGKSTPDAMSEFYGYTSEYMTGVTGNALDAYESGFDWFCGCSENLTVYQTSTGRWLKGYSTSSIPLDGIYSLDGTIYSFINGIAQGGAVGYCSAFC
jgi:hypothetical protein